MKGFVAAPVVVVCAIGLIVSLYPRYSRAEVTSNGTVPTALKGIKRASGTCSPDEPAPDAKSIPILPAISPDFSCAISVEKFAPILGHINTIVADLRSGDEYQRFHLEGAMTLTSTELRTKPYWRNMTVVLVGNGKAENELYRECAVLKRSGYGKVHVLRGGMPQWLADGRSVMGSPLAATDSIRLSAAEFLVETRNPQNLIVLTREQQSMKGELPLARVLAETTADAMKATLAQRAKDSKRAAVMAVVVAAPSGLSDDQIRKLQQAVMPTPLLIYGDSREAFIKQVSAQKAMWSARTRGPRKPRCG